MRSSSAALRWPLLVLLVLPLSCIPASKPSQRKSSTAQRAAATASRGHQAPARGTPQEPRPSPPPANTFARDMVEAHNAARAEARPTPKPALPPLVWSDAAMKQAASWAKACKFEHNPDRGDFGENLAAATPDAWGTRQVVKSWADEVTDYDHARNTCKKGKVCGHYTQVVWRNTTAVGCATVLCKKNSPFGEAFPTWQLWVCNYTPPGNFVGQRPY